MAQPTPRPTAHAVAAQARCGDSPYVIQCDSADADRAPTHIGSDALSPAHLAVRPWTALGETTTFVEIVAEDTESQARVRVDLSTAQATALRDCLNEMLSLPDAA